MSRLLMPLFDKRLEMLHSSINSALSQINTNAQKIADLENRLASYEVTTANMEQALAQHQDSERLLHDKIEDLENRSRRSNLRFIGIPESFGGAALLTFLTTDLTKALAMDEPPDPYSIERAHRIGPQRPPGEVNGRPRPVIAKYLNWAVKEKVLRAYRRKGMLQIGENNILIFQDFSAGVTIKRKAFTPICKYLHDQAIRFQLLYPAKLRVQVDGRQLLFDDPVLARRHFNIQDNGPPG